MFRRDYVSSMAVDKMMLWRPVGPEELKQIEDAGMMAFPPSSSEQSVFYPKSTKNHAIEVAREWNAPVYGKGFVVCVDVRKDLFDHLKVSHTRENAQQEFWLPLEDIEALNASLMGRIKVSHRFPD